MCSIFGPKLLRLFVWVQCAGLPPSRAVSFVFCFRWLVVILRQNALRVLFRHCGKPWLDVSNNATIQHFVLVQVELDAFGRCYHVIGSWRKPGPRVSFARHEGDARHALVMVTFNQAGPGLDVMECNASHHSVFGRFFFSQSIFRFEFSYEWFWTALLRKARPIGHYTVAIVRGA